MTFFNSPRDLFVITSNWLKIVSFHNSTLVCMLFKSSQTPAERDCLKMFQKIEIWQHNFKSAKYCFFIVEDENKFSMFLCWECVLYWRVFDTAFQRLLSFTLNLPYPFHPKCERCKVQYFQFLSLTAFLSSFFVLFFFFSLTVSFSFSLPFLFFTFPFFYVSSFLLFALLSSFVSFRSNHLFSVILSLQFLMHLSFLFILCSFLLIVILFLFQSSIY